MARHEGAGTRSVTLDLLHLAEANVTERELEVFRLLGRRLKTKEVALRLVISVATVRTHVRNVCRKLGVSGRVSALVELWERGLLGPRENI